MVLELIDILVYLIGICFVLLLLPYLITLPFRFFRFSGADKDDSGKSLKAWNKNVRYFSVLAIVILFMLVILIMSISNILVGIR